jgi:uncharacterized membrane protein
MPQPLQAPPPPHAILLGFPPALFLSALAADIAFLRTAQMQWSNFAAWLIAGAMVFSVSALLWGAVEALLHRTARLVLVLGLLILLTALGLLNAFQHSRDGWSSVGGLGLALSILTSLIAIAAAWVRFAAAGSKGSA